MTASIKEALELARNTLASLRARLKTEPSVQGRGWVSLGIVTNDAIEKADAALATLQPSGERREAIARAVRSVLMDGLESNDPDDWLIPMDSEAIGDLCEHVADAILASGLVQDEAGASVLGASLGGSDQVEDVNHVVRVVQGHAVEKDAVIIDDVAGAIDNGPANPGLDHVVSHDAALGSAGSQAPEGLAVKALDEAAIRADEREKCERCVEELDCLYVNGERVPFGGTPADPESCIYRAAIKAACTAIRSARNGGAET